MTIVATAIRTSTGQVDISPTPPTVGQVLTSTSPTTAAWLDPLTGSAPWSRPVEWMSLPTIDSVNDELIVGLLAVKPLGTRLALTISGAYTVDWGDGAIENFAAGVTAKHTYDFATTPGTALSTGFKQVLVKVTPQVGSHLTSINLISPYDGTIIPFSNWQELILGGSFLTSLSMGGYFAMLESAEIFHSPGITSAASLFSASMALRKVLVNLPSATNASGLFLNCIVLTNIDQLVLGDLTNISSMFSGCYAIKTIPSMTLMPGTNASGAFVACVELTVVPTLTYNNIANASNLFSSCMKLKDVTLDLSSATHLSSTFSSCLSLNKATLTTSSTLTTTNSMFSSSKLIEVNAFDTSGVLDASQMFSGCFRLNAVPPFNFASALFPSGTGPFVNCKDLVEIAATGIKDYLDLSSTRLSKSKLETVISGLAVVAGKELKLTGATGSDPNYTTNGVTVKVTANATNTVTLANTSGITVGKSVVGLRALTSKTISSTGQNTLTFTSTAHGLVNGQKVTIASATPGLSNNGSNYLQVGSVGYISNVTANTFQISPSTGGTYYATSSSSASSYAVSFVMDITDSELQQTSKLITAVVSNTSVTLAEPLTITGSAQLEIRDVSVYADTTLAIYKGWKVT